MKITSGEYVIQPSGLCRPESDHVTLEAIKIAGGKRLGHISMEILPDQGNVVKLGKITTCYTVPVWPRSVFDYGNSGVGTRLLLEGMYWATNKGATNLVGRFVPEKDLYTVKAWYENRNICVSEDLQDISGYVPAIVASCLGIIARY